MDPSQMSQTLHQQQSDVHTTAHLLLGRYHEAPNAGQVGYMALVRKSSMKPYQLTKPDCMPHVSPRTRAYVRDMDLALLETLGRENLVILSYLDTFLAAIASAMSDIEDTEPFLLRAISASGSTLAELTQRSVAIVHHASIHRRDIALFGLHLSAQQIAPFLAETVLFDPTTLRAVTEEDIEKANNEALVRAICSSLQTPRHLTPKRPAAVTKSATKRPAQTAPSFPKVKKQKQAVPTPAPTGPTPRSLKQTRYR